MHCGGFHLKTRGGIISRGLKGHAQLINKQGTFTSLGHAIHGAIV